MRKLPRHKNPPRPSSDELGLSRGDALPWLANLALVLLLGFVASRALMLETLRDPFEPSPGSEMVPGGPGAGTSVFLDLLCCIPALLMLARRAFGGGEYPRRTYAPLFFFFVAGWACVSVIWASDQFAAAVGASHLIAAAAILWAATQFTRDWVGLRLIAGVCFGLLLAYSARGAIYRYIELPDLQRTFEQHKEEFLQQRGWEPGSFIAEQFSQKIVKGEMIGFSASPNTYAAVIVLLTLVTLAAVIQRLVDRDERGWAVGMILPLPLALLILWLTQSRTALAGLILGVLALIAFRWLRGAVRNRPRTIYAAGLAFAVLGAIALIAHGVYHGGLFPGRFGDSLNFRWRYWTSAFDLALQHPLLGVGWNNFGDAYLAVRQLNAPEEIRDPHNFLVRALTELGIIGLVLFAAWVARGAWEVTRQRPSPSVDESSAAASVDTASNRTGGPAIAIPAAIACFTFVTTLISTIDWSQDPNYIFIEGCKLALYAALILAGGVIVTLRSSTQQVLDDRPAPWLLTGMTIAIGVFLLHCLVDVALFETGALLVIAMIIGGVSGLRSPRAIAARRPARIALGIAGAAVFVAAVLFVFPIASGQRASFLARNAMREMRFRDAVRLTSSALQRVPYNADYAYQAASALAFARAPYPAVRAMIDRAITMHPQAAAYPLLKARYELRGVESPDISRARAGFERALELNPNDVRIRLEYADALLDRMNDPAEALKQYREALRYNDALNLDEGKRLQPKELADVEAKIAAIRSMLDQ